MEILLTSIIPCGWSSCLISSSCILSSSSHLITNFDEFRILCGETLTGKYPSSLVVFRRFLHCCLVSTSIKTLPDFMGLTLSSSAFAIPSIAFFRTNAFKSSGIFLSAASMIRNLGHLSSSCISLVRFEDSFWVGVEVEHGDDVFLCLFMLIKVWWGLEVYLQD